MGQLTMKTSTLLCKCHHRKPQHFCWPHILIPLESHRPVCLLATTYNNTQDIFTPSLLENTTPISRWCFSPYETLLRKILFFTKRELDVLRVANQKMLFCLSVVCNACGIITVGSVSNCVDIISRGVIKNLIKCVQSFMKYIKLVFLLTFKNIKRCNACNHITKIFVCVFFYRYIIVNRYRQVSFSSRVLLQNQAQRCCFHNQLGYSWGSACELVSRER